MKIEQRGFGITEVSERVAGVDGDAEEARIVFVLPAGEGQASRWLRADDVKALAEALTVAHGLMTGETPTAPRPPVAAEMPGAFRDGQGDRWTQVGNTDRYVAEGEGCTFEWVERTYGLRSN